MRLQTFLSKSGITSRRKAADLIKSGKISVNGRIVLEPGYAVDPASGHITCLGRNVVPEAKAYYLFHKPRGVITTVEDAYKRRTVRDFFRSVPVRLYPAGRLDRDTTGLLVMTNDGEFANRLTHPRFGLEKIYEARIHRALTEPDVKRFERGLRIQGYLTSPCRIEAQGRSEKKFFYKITLHEGRKRQIREMMSVLGVRVLSLHRIQVGPLKLGTLKAGAFRPLTEAERKACLGVKTFG